MLVSNSNTPFLNSRTLYTGPGIEGIAAGLSGAAASGKRFGNRAKDGHPEWPPG